MRAPEQQSHGEQPPQPTPLGRRLLAHALPLVLLIGATGFAGAWRSEQVRLWSVENLGPIEMVNLEDALSDPAPEVASLACSHLLPLESRQVSPQAIDTLYQRPQVARRCFETLAADTQAEDSEEVTSGSTWRLIASQLSRRWLEASRQSDTAECTAAQSARRSMEAAELSVEYPMLRCAVLASDGDARRCCIEELGGDERFAELLEAPEGVPLHRARRDFDGLVASSFEPAAPAQPEESAEGSEDAEAATTTASESVESKIQDWVVGVGCRIHQGEPGERVIVRAFRDLFEAPACAPDGKPRPAFYDAYSWGTVCAELYPHQRKELRVAPREAICSSLELASIDDAVGGARDGVSYAVSKALPVTRGDEDRIEVSAGAGRGTKSRGQYRRTSSRAAAASRSMFRSMSRQLFR
ncbi:MAG: hypothetical protein ACLFVJ_06600 [Persicimonas sp.]